MSQAFLDLKPEKIITGMALGVDQWAAALAVRHGIPFIAAIPCLEQETVWNSDVQDRYWQILKLASEVVVVTQTPYNPTVMAKRNLWMLDRADAVLAIWDGSRGGTGHCVAEALKRNIPVHRILPETGERIIMLVGKPVPRN